jgi:hypothetical protein
VGRLSQQLGRCLLQSGCAVPSNGIGDLAVFAAAVTVIGLHGRDLLFSID